MRSTLTIRSPGKTNRFDLVSVTAHFNRPEAADFRQLVLTTSPIGDDWQRILGCLRRGAVAGHLDILLEPDDEDDQDQHFVAEAAAENIQIDWGAWRRHEEILYSPASRYWSMEFLVTATHWMVLLP